jgi:hypothetical protein
VIDKEASMSELSHFEQQAAQIPKKQPYAILIGAALLPILLSIINWLSPTDAVKDLKEKEQEAQQDIPAASAADDGEEI